MPELTTIQMYAAAGGDAAASIDIPADGQLVGLDWAANFGELDTIEDSAQAEVSFNSTNQRTTNDARAAISSIKKINTGSTIEGVDGSVNKFVDLKDGITVMGGERIYLHVGVDAGVSVACAVVLYFRFRTTRRAATRRR